MNTNVLEESSARYEKLAKPKKRRDETSNYNAFRVKRGALSYQITDSLNRLAQPKRKTGSNATGLPCSAGKVPSTGTAGQGHRELINSSEQSRDSQESRKKKFLLDTYARITAARNRGCSRRLHELAKPKNPSPRLETDEHFDNYFRTIKKCNAKPLIAKRA